MLVFHTTQHSLLSSRVAANQVAVTFVVLKGHCVRAWESDGKLKFFNEYVGFCMGAVLNNNGSGNGIELV